jgi:hypothetical protein
MGSGRWRLRQRKVPKFQWSIHSSETRNCREQKRWEALKLRVQPPVASNWRRLLGSGSGTRLIHSSARARGPCGDQLRQPPAYRHPECDLLPSGFRIPAAEADALARTLRSRNPVRRSALRSGRPHCRNLHTSWPNLSAEAPQCRPAPVRATANVAVEPKREVGHGTVEA